jgi:DNA polymerase I-like protein with 3'-5' exonuclease and polymerase domains
MGNIAASAVFGTKVKILTHRIGPAKESHKYPGVPVISTVHPAFVLRVADALPMLMDDMAKLKPQIQVGWEEPDYRVYEDVQQAKRALRMLQLRNPSSVVVDIEVGAEKDESFDRPDKLRLLCVGLCYAPGRAIVIGEQALWDHGVRAELAGVLDTTRVVAHNGKFDLAGLRPVTTGARLGFDTMLASYVCDERSGTHGLKYLAMERLGAPNYATLIHKYITRKGQNFAHVPTEVLHKYNAYDVACTWGLMEIYEERMRRENLTSLHDMLCRASDMLQVIETRGLRVDLDYLDKIRIEFEDDLEDLDESLSQWVENARSPVQVREALAKLGHPVGSTAVGVLDKLVDSRKAGDFVKLLLQHRRQSKLYGTYTKGILSRITDGYVHPTFLLHGTTTGRLSCRSPNL